MSESSSEEENADRFKEAAWSFGSQDVKISGEDKDSSGMQSHRTEVSKHEHDGNELGTTPEFRSHVAKKLRAILDGSIAEVCSDTVALQTCQSKSTEEEDDEGFRLFSTSAPGKWMEPTELSPPRKRRPVPSSSSDSEMEMRLREAAVSVSDLLGPSAQPLTEKKSGETEGGGEKDTADAVPKKRKRQRKRKTLTEASEKVLVQSEKQSNGDADDRHNTTEIVTKKKKKKKRKTLKDGGNVE